MKQENTSTEEFFEYLAKYMGDGDILTCLNDGDDFQIFRLYGFSICDNERPLIAEYTNNPNVEFNVTYY